jgi:SPP1 gp7 family putative phage head morphogenesis protein
LSSATQARAGSKPPFSGAGGISLHSLHSAQLVELQGGRITKAFAGIDNILSARLQLGGEESAKFPLKQDEYLYAAATTKASAVRSVPLVVYEDDRPEMDNPADASDPLVRLVTARPNRAMTFGEVMYRAVLNRVECGENWWALADSEGKPVRLQGDYIATPAQIIPMTGRIVQEGDQDATTGLPKTWRWSAATGAESAWPVHAMLPFIDADPYRQFRGVGVAEVLDRLIAVKFQVNRYLHALAANGGEPGGVISVPTQTAAEEIRRSQAEMDSFQSNPDNRGRFLVLGGEATFTPNTLAPKDMEFVQLLEWVREAALGLVGVPAPCVGVFKDANYSMYAEATRAMWVGPNGVLTYLRSIEAVLNERFFPSLADARYRKFRAYFDTTGIAALQSDNSAKVEAAARTSVTVGIPFNAALELHGVDASVEGGDVAPNPFGLDDTDESEGEDEAPEVEDAEDDAGDEAESPDESEKSIETRDARDLTTREARVEYWRSIEKAVHVPAEQLVFRAARTLLRRYADAQLARLREFARDTKRFDGYVKREIAQSELAEQVKILLLNKSEWEEKMRRLFEQPLERVTSLALTQAAEEVSSISIGVGDPRITEALLAQQIKLAEGVTSTLAERVKTALMKELSQASSIADLQAAVRERLPELEGSVRQVFANKDARAQVIARTEAGHAAKSARFEQFKSDGITKIRWITQGDGAVRESHVALDGDVVSLGGRFKNGLAYPQDQNGPAEEVIQCRCTTAPVFED